MSFLIPHLLTYSHTMFQPLQAFTVVQTWMPRSCPSKTSSKLQRSHEYYIIAFIEWDYVTLMTTPFIIFFRMSSESGPRMPIDRNISECMELGRPHDPRISVRHKTRIFPHYIFRAYSWLSNKTDRFLHQIRALQFLRCALHKSRPCVWPRQCYFPEYVGFNH